MVEELIGKIKKQVNKLGEEIERIELGENGTSVFIKIKEGNCIDGDFFLSGNKGTIVDSLIYIKDVEIEELRKEVEDVNDFWQADEDTKRDTNRWLNQQC